MQRVLLSVFLLASCGWAGAPIRVVTIGDSHATVEAGFAQALADEWGRPVLHENRGVVGASIHQLLDDLEGRSQQYHLAALSSWEPNVVFLAFGTNEAKNWSEARAGAYLAEWNRVLDRVPAIFPNASVIVLGPPDAAALPGLASVRRLEAAAALQHGMGWLDRIALMGGEHSISVWMTAQGGRYAARDGVHLSKAGYCELAQRVARAVARSRICRGRSWAPE